MKINEKSLTHFASFGLSAHKEGFLEKKGEVNHSYKKRWFSLKGNLLFYFEKPGDNQPIGVIVVENCSVEIYDCERFSFCIRFPGFDCAGLGSSRTYVLCAENDVEMELWMKAISSSSYAYVEVLVQEFKKTLERLKSETEDCQSERASFGIHVKTPLSHKGSQQFTRKDTITENDEYDSGQKDAETSTFESLHLTFGAAIWTKIDGTCK